LVEDINTLPNDDARIAEQNDLRQRYYAHIQREETRRLHRKGPVVRAEIDTTLFAQFSSQLNSVPAIEMTEKASTTVTTQDAKSTIELAKLRTQIKKLEKQLSVREDATKRAQLLSLTDQLNALLGA
jgi:electron transport complex protein RnfB